MEEEQRGISIELAGLWQQPKGHFAGMVKQDIELKQGEYFLLFPDSNPNPKSPEFNLVIYRDEGSELAKLAKKEKK